MNMAGYPSFKSIWRLFYSQDQIFGDYSTVKTKYYYLGDYLEIILPSSPNGNRGQCARSLHYSSLGDNDIIFIGASIVQLQENISFNIVTLNKLEKKNSAPPLLTKENNSFSICGDYDSEKNISLHIS